MSIENIDIKLGGDTVVTATGSSASFARDGVPVASGIHFVNIGQVFPNQTQLTIKSRPPILDTKTGTYGKVKKSISLARPFSLPSGQVVFNTIRFEVEVHPLMDSYLDPGASDDLIDQMVQLIASPALSAFRSNGSL